MTSVNALRINRDTGILLCDEASYWNEEWMILYTPDKIQSVVKQDLIDRYRLAFFVGMSGSTMMGDRVMDGMTQHIQRLFDERNLTVTNRLPRKITIEQLAWDAFEVLKQVKVEYVNDYLISRFGFTTAELIAGKYERNGKTISIEDDEVKKEALRFVTGDDQPQEIGYVFRNTLFLAGYTPDEGFRIYFMNTMNSICEDAAEIFVNGGSGTDTNELVYTDFAMHVPLVDRREGIDLLDGTIAAFQGVTTAFRITAGVAPYPNFTHIDGNSKTLVRKIFDKRTQLVAEIIASFNRGLIERAAVRELVDLVLFKDLPFEKADKLFWERVKDKRETQLFLRGYALERPIQPHSAPMPNAVK
ncbi:hypothetical protein JXQ70_18145 [bacterium]|nr:hypothetical protein [bacterium]